MSTPRGKGIFPEDHPLYLGTTGMGGTLELKRRLAAHAPRRVLVLGTRLGEMSSFWDEDFVPQGGIVHVDVDASAFGAAYPSAPTFGVVADARRFVETLLTHFPTGRTTIPMNDAEPPPAAPPARREHLVRPRALMAAIQREIVEATDAIVLTEAGNAFAWGSHALRFSTPGRYRVSVGFGSMGHGVAGVIGAALGRPGKAVSIAGDGSMLMLSEISTAVAHALPCVWIVLNDARYGMTSDGMRSVGFEPHGMEIPRADFVAIARGMGADGVRVELEDDLDTALRLAMASPTPFVVDVQIDPSEPAPVGPRNQKLIEQWRKGESAMPPPPSERSPS